MGGTLRCSNEVSSGSVNLREPGYLALMVEIS